VKSVRGKQQRERPDARIWGSGEFVDRSVEEGEANLQIVAPFEVRREMAREWYILIV
jgi:hypothetical protein